MNANIIKVGPGKRSYFYDLDKQKRLFGYSPRNKNCILVLDDGKHINQIGQEDLYTDRAGDICIYDEYNRKIIIDDGWKSTLQRCGYIVYKDYDKNMITIHEKGVAIKNKIREHVYSTLSDMNLEVEETGPFKFKFSVISKDGKYQYIFYIDSLSSIVNKNQARKYNNLQYLPFRKEMDKYATLYLSVFSKRIKPSTKDTDNREEIDQIIAKIMLNLGIEYKYVSNILNARILEFDD